MNGGLKWLVGTIIAVLALSLSFVGGAFAFGVDKGRIEAKLDSLEKKLDETVAQVQAGMDDRFRGSDWERERRWIEAEFDRLGDQIGSCCVMVSK